MPDLARPSPAAAAPVKRDRVGRRNPDALGAALRQVRGQMRHTWDLSVKLRWTGASEVCGSLRSERDLFYNVVYSQSLVDSVLLLLPTC